MKSITILIPGGIPTAQAAADIKSALEAQSAVLEVHFRSESRVEVVIDPVDPEALPMDEVLLGALTGSGFSGEVENDCGRDLPPVTAGAAG